MKVTMKRLLKRPFIQRVISFLISLCLRFIYATSSVSKHMPQETIPYFFGEKQAIFCFWHGNMIMHPFVRPKSRPMKVLISHHRDGALITNVLLWFGVGTVRGSSRKGGAAAMRSLMQALEDGANISITPDGPRGPAFEVAGGAAWLAKKLELPLIPIAFSASRGKYFSSWDRFLLPYPFCHLHYEVGSPIFANTNTDENILRETLRKSLMACMDKANQANQ